MGWRDRRRTKTATSSVSAKDEVTVRFLEFLGVSGANKNAMSEATYFACIKILSESVGKLSLRLLQHTPDGGIRKCREHPLYHITGSHPNPYMTATTFWSTVECNRNHHGNGYAWISGAGKRCQLWPLPSDAVTVWVDNKGLWGAPNAVWYTYQGESGGPLRIPHDSMLHVRTAASFDGITGKPMRNILTETIEGNLTAQEMLNKSYKNGFSGKAVLQYTGDLSPENEKKFAKRIDEYINGQDFESVIPMMYGTQLVGINTKLAENDFLGLKKYSALQIAAAFGIKPNQINDYEKSSYASAEAQQLAFYVDTLLFILKQYEEELSEKLLTTDEIRNGYFFKFNVASILRADQKTQVESLRTGVQGGLYTPNEARAFLDLPAIAGGDKLLVNGNMVSVDEAGAAYRGRG
jgi:HK97 family phage portal protein